MGGLPREFVRHLRFIIMDYNIPEIRFEGLWVSGVDPAASRMAG
jgi:hypothetical protein